LQSFLACTGGIDFITACLEPRFHYFNYIRVVINNKNSFSIEPPLMTMNLAVSKSSTV
jgi:hypothetical protein